MLAKVLSASYLGVEGYPVVVEVDISPGLPAFDLVGLANTAVQEARQRVRSALKNSPYPYPLQRITINLAPADIPKQGSYFDLPIAVGILAAQSILPYDNWQKYAYVGELSLDGQIRPIRGALAMALTIRDLGLQGLVLPRENYTEAKAVQHIELIPVSHIEELVQFLSTGKVNYPILPAESPKTVIGNDLAQVKGQPFARRGVEIAAAGGHNLFLVGPPGSGKTLLSKTIPSLLPPLSEDESLEVTRIHSIAGLLEEPAALRTDRPFRQPHHSTTPAALIGGGRVPIPGEVSLAHRGVLFLDEMAEFRSDLLDLLRQPLEMGEVVITRNRHRLTFPANFILIGAANPCKCGYYGDPSNQCVCSPAQVHRYFQRISGPLLDRFDLQIPVSRMTSDELFSTEQVESSAEVRNRVLIAREMQKNRFQSTGLTLNSQIPASLIDQYCPLTPEIQQALAQAMDKLKLTARGCHQILKVARTLADLRQEESITLKDLAEAIQYRVFDRIYH